SPPRPVERLPEGGAQREVLLVVPLGDRPRRPGVGEGGVDPAERGEDLRPAEQRQRQLRTLALALEVLGLVSPGERGLELPGGPPPRRALRGPRPRLPRPPGRARARLLRRPRARPSPPRGAPDRPADRRRRGAGGPRRRAPPVRAPR